jgi:hypothetical protein
MNAPNLYLLQFWEIHIGKYCVIRYSICYVDIQLHRVSKFQVLMYIFYLTVICIPISNHINQIRHVQQHYETWSVVNIMNAPNLYLLQSWAIHIGKYCVIWSCFNNMYSYSCSENNTQPILISLSVGQYSYNCFDILWLTIHAYL